MSFDDANDVRNRLNIARRRCLYVLRSEDRTQLIPSCYDLQVRQVVEKVSDEIHLLKYELVLRFVSALIDLSSTVTIYSSVSALIRLAFLLPPTLHVFLCFFTLLLLVEIVFVLAKDLIRLVTVRLVRFFRHRVVP